MIDVKEMNYWELRKHVSKIVPRMTQIFSSSRKAEIVREKGRKKNYSQFNLRHGEWRKQERLLNTEEINSFLEISVRAAACPMPFNMDIWDGLICPYNCIYCFPAGTKILMVDGSEKVIERIRKGDRIMSFNEKTKRLEPADVMETMKRPYKDKLICIETEDGQILRMTPEHPVFTTQKGWVEARNLTENMEVLTW
jgi:hypothetical protein